MALAVHAGTGENTRRAVVVDLDRTELDVRGHGLGVDGLGYEALVVRGRAMGLVVTQANAATTIGKMIMTMAMVG